jgi:hypothetical protein
MLKVREGRYGLQPVHVVSTFQRGRIPNLLNARVLWSYRSDALYQGTTLVGPLAANKDLGFSPCAFFSLPGRCTSPALTGSEP